MLAAGGLLGLLLMGAAVGGLMAGGGETTDDDVAPADAEGRGDAEVAEEVGETTGDLLSGAVDAADGERPVGGSLAEILFGPIDDDPDAEDAPPTGGDEPAHPVGAAGDDPAQDGPPPWVSPPTYTTWWRPRPSARGRTFRS